MNEKIHLQATRALNECSRIVDFNERIGCKAKVLHAITEFQDHANLSIMSDFRNNDPGCSTDDRWIPVHIVDNANAIILGISRNRFKPSLFMSEGYVKEKMESLIDKWRMIHG